MTFPVSRQLYQLYREVISPQQFPRQKHASSLWPSLLTSSGIITCTINTVYYDFFGFTIDGNPGLDLSLSNPGSVF